SHAVMAARARRDGRGGSGGGERGHPCRRGTRPFASRSIHEWGVFASTTEALTVTLLTELVRRTSKHPEVPSSVSAIFDGVYVAARFVRKRSHGIGDRGDRGVAEAVAPGAIG